MKKILIPVVLLSFSTACAQVQTLGVKPWERGVLAKPEMALDAAPLTTALDEHIYFSKEGSSGGRGFAGGGCGCN